MIALGAHLPLVADRRMPRIAANQSFATPEMKERHGARYTPEGGVFDALAMLLGRRDAGRDVRHPWGAETDVSACYLAAAANGCAAAAGRFSLRNPRTCRSAIWICLGFAFHGYRVTWAFGAR